MRQSLRRRARVISAVVLAILILRMDPRARATTYSFVATSGDYGDGANWKNTAPPNSTGTVPDLHDNGSIGSTMFFGADVTLSDDRSIAKLTVGYNSTLELTGGTLTVNQLNLGAGNLSGSLTHSGGSIKSTNIMATNASQFEIIGMDEITPETKITISGFGSQMYYNHYDSETMSTLNLSKGGAVSLVSGVLHTAYLYFGLETDTPDDLVVTLFHNSGTLDVQTSLEINAGNVFTVMAGDTFTNATVNVLGPGSNLKLNSDLTSASVALFGGAAVNRNGGFFHVHDLEVDSGSTLTALSGDSIASGGNITVDGGFINYGGAIPDHLASIKISNGGTLQYSTLTTDFLSVDDATLSGGNLNFSWAEISHGNFSVTSGDIVADGGTISAGVGGILSYSNPQNHLSIVRTLGGTLNLLAGGVLQADTIGIQNGGTFNRGATIFTGIENITIDSGGTFTVEPNDTTAGGGTISVSGPGSVLNLTHDITQQAASVSVSDGGAIYLNGHNLNTQSLSISTGSTSTPGMINRGGGHISLSSIALLAGANFAIEPDDLVTSGGTILISNSGASLTYDNTSSAVIALTTIHDGTLELQGGTLHTQNLDLGDSSFSNPAYITRSGGAISVTNYATIENGSSFQIGAGDDFTGALLWVRIGATLDLAGNSLPVKNLMLDGTLNRNGGGFAFQQLSVNNGSAFTIGPEDTVANGGSISSASSTLSIERDITTPLASVYLGDSTLQLNGHALRTDSLSIVNSTVARTGGSFNLQSVAVSSGSTFDIEPTDTLRDGGMITVQNPGTILNYNNTPTMENIGNDFQPAYSPLGTINQVTINDSATLNLQGGTLQTFFLNLGDANSPGNLIRSGGNLDVVFSADVAGGSTLTIGPDDDFSSASLTVEPGATLDLAGNTLAVSSLSIGGTLVRNGGHFLFGGLGVSAGQNFTLADNDDIAPDGNIQVSGSGAVLTIQSVLSNQVSNTSVSDGGILNLSTDLHTRQLGIYGGTVSRSGGILDVQYLSVTGGIALTLTSNDILKADGSIDVEGAGSILNLSIPAAGVANEALSDVTVGDNAVLNLNGRDLTIDRLSLTGGTFNRGGARINTQSISLSSGSNFAFESTDTLRGGGAVYVSDGSTLSLASSPTDDVSAVVLQSGAVMNLNGYALDTDYLEIDGSTLNRGGAALNVQAVSLSQGSTLALQSSDVLRAGGSIYVADAGSQVDLGVTPTGSLTQLVTTNGGILNLNGHDITADSLVIDSGGVLNRGGAHLDVQNIGVYTGSSLVLQSTDTLRGDGGVIVEDAGSTLDLNSSPVSPVSQTYVFDGGTLNLNGHPYSSSYFQLGSTTYGVLNRAGATLTAQDVRIYAGSILDITTDDSLGSINVANTGSTLNVNGPLSASLGDILLSNDAVANFDAGAVTITSIQGIGVSTAKFNGAFLSPSQSNPNWISGSTNAIVQTGGARFNTNGYDVAISTSLAHDPTLGATPDGGLSKNGLGTLVLSGVNTYTGLTTVAAAHSPSMAPFLAPSKSTPAPLSKAPVSLALSLFSPAGISPPATPPARFPSPA